MIRWYSLVRLCILAISLFYACLLLLIGMPYLKLENGPRTLKLIGQKQLPEKLPLETHDLKEQMLVNLLPDNHQSKEELHLEKSTDYTNVQVEGQARYRLPYDPTVQGQAFPFSNKDLRNFRLDIVRTLTQVPDDVREHLVLVTAASSGFYRGAMAVISGTQMYFPNQTLLVYDLGGSGGLEQMVQGQAKGVPCQVEFRMFNFTKYPDHVKGLRNYAWKFLIVKEVLETHDALFWLDSSINLKNPLPFSLNLHEYPIKLMAYSGHSNFAVTHPGMYSFFPTDREKQKKTLQYEANSMLIVNTKAAFEGVLKWVYLCALYKDCIAPKGSSTSCNLRENPYTYHTGGCHRFDQAAVNLLLGNNMNFDYPSYVFNNGDYKIFMVRRGQRLSGVIKTCV